MTTDRPSTMDKILLSHGEGGKRTRDLIGTVIARYFANPVLAPFFDSGLLGRIDGEIAFTTDGHVVTPAFFPGGDIGRLAVSGTVNDLAVCGAKGLAISCGLVLEEGLPIETLERALASMRDAAAEAGVVVACGDTKVVEKGKGDGIFITTAGVGVMVDGWRPAPEAVRPGDRILLSGTMGDHYVAVLIARQGLSLSASVRSDVAPIGGMILPLLERFGEQGAFHARPHAGRRRRDAQRDGLVGEGPLRPGGGAAARARIGARGVRDPRIRPAVPRQRGEGAPDRRRFRRGRGARRPAGAPAGTGTPRSSERSGKGRPASGCGRSPGACAPSTTPWETSSPGSAERRPPKKN